MEEIIAPNFLRADGHIQLRVELHCADEKTASERAKQLADDHDVDLWEGARLIRTRIQRMHIGVIRRPPGVPSVRMR
ncbi:hypothetical protein [Bradyrhizobium sp. BR 1432]|uniref:hypothetical protein n=1 Tax=Bradyrhizobium sp. BR 1432 TaxID=3447966 RepID=UPI003EE6CE13